MSVLILGKGNGIKTNGVYYRVLKQAPGITCMGEDDEAITLGTYNGWRFVSSGSLMFCYGPGRRSEFFLRGRSPEYNDNDNDIFLLDTYVEGFEKAVLEFNVQRSNNKHLDVEDVIWAS